MTPEDVELSLGRRVTSLDPTGKRLMLDDGTLAISARLCSRRGRAGAAAPSGREWAGRNVASRMCNPCDLRSGRLLWEVQEMTTIPHDSDIIGATALLALVLVIGLVRVFGL
jgi:hypothetical protein